MVFMWQLKTVGIRTSGRFLHETSGASCGCSELEKKKRNDYVYVQLERAAWRGEKCVLLLARSLPQLLGIICLETTWQ